MRKNRDSVIDERKKVPVNVRIHKTDSVKLDKIAKEKGQNISTTTREAISLYIREHERQFSQTSQTSENVDYVCYACGNAIKLDEKYYIELANLERFVKNEINDAINEIEVLDSLPNRILCSKCVIKEGKLKQFEEIELKTQKIIKSKRILKD